MTTLVDTSTHFAAECKRQTIVGQTTFSITLGLYRDPINALAVWNDRTAAATRRIWHHLLGQFICCHATGTKG
jgi:hypothetical protein